ncbi:MAG: Brp/Blh family beta-carotene 15,15'-dioxygenase [Bacteroidia bacterium]|nr:Brp/Blh family beta-carotene 15,15'-dioxygenase [Bacteroidia bacterium]
MKIENFNIVTTFLALWLAVTLGSTLENYLAYFLILSIGILHGSNDIRIINKVQNNGNRSLKQSLLGYILIVLLGTALFYFIPALGLVVFILISGYHFGEQHFSALESDYQMAKFGLYFFYGCFVIFLLLFTNALEAQDIIYNIAQFNVDKPLLMIPLLIAGIGFGSAMAFFAYKGLLPKWYKELFFLFVFFIVFSTAGLLWSFAIYFILWHSLPSLLHQIAFLNGKITKDTIFNYVKTSFIYWFISVVGLFLFFIYLVEDQDLFLAIFFSFLAAITFPHVLVMSKIFEH